MLRAAPTIRFRAEKRLGQVAISDLLPGRNTSANHPHRGPEAVEPRPDNANDLLDCRSARRHCTRWVLRASAFGGVLDKVFERRICRKRRSTFDVISIGLFHTFSVGFGLDHLHEREATCTQSLSHSFRCRLPDTIEPFAPGLSEQAGMLNHRKML